MKLRSRPCPRRGGAFADYAIDGTRRSAMNFPIPAARVRKALER